MMFFDEGPDNWYLIFLLFNFIRYLAFVNINALTGIFVKYDDIVGIPS